jgi:Cu/Ag efflux protein CusF
MAAIHLNPNMNPNLIKLSKLALLPAAWLTLTGCSSTTQVDKITTTSFKEGVPGGVLKQTYQTTTTVKAIDPDSRQVTLVAPDGSQNTFKAGPKVVLDQIKAGDEVKVTVARELAMYLNPNDVPATTSPAALVRATPGVQPGVLTADPVEYTATVEAVDLSKHEAILHISDGRTARSRFARMWISRR